MYINMHIYIYIYTHTHTRNLLYRYMTPGESA